jgi:uncharacterized surface protein with fasciclin (FAS1) repeats
MSVAVLNNMFAPYISNAATHADTTHSMVNDLNVAKNAAKLISTSEEVIRMINYNHIPGLALYSPDLVNGSTFMTAAGVDVTITIGLDESIWVNDAKLIGRDLLVSNGVMHVVDKVPIPSPALIEIYFLTSADRLDPER